MATVEKTTSANGAVTTDGKTFDIESPADGSVVGTLPDMGAEEVAAVAARLRSAQPEWEAIGPEARKKHMLNWLGWILDNEDSILSKLQAETGKSAGDTNVETMVAVDVINYYAKNAAEFLQDKSLKPHNAAGRSKKLRVFHKPYQLVGQIFPWNYPLGMPMMDVPPALAAGAAVLTKPSEFTPLSWVECVRGWEEIGAPPVLAAVTGLGATGAAVIEHVDYIQFTGSTRTGKNIAKSAAERLIPFSLELGGKDAMIVLDDANVDRAVAGAVWAGFFNAGQSCVSVERVYVQEGIYDEFVSKITDKTNELRVGSEPRGKVDCDYGALANDGQMAIVERHVQDAIDKGARAVTGGKRQDKGLFYEPTVLVDVDHTMQCMTEETFGPTIPIMKVRDEEEAVRLANDSPYGLGGSVWTGDEARGERVARRLETGAVNVNNAMVNLFNFPLPHNGWKESGLGARFGGADGLLKFCRKQAYIAERMDLDTELHWYPRTKGKERIIGSMVRLLGAPGWKRKLGRKG